MDTNKVSILLKSLRLPQRVSWYEVDGQVLFQLKDNSTDYICYLIRRPHTPNSRTGPYYKYGIRLKNNMSINDIFHEIQSAISEFRKALKSADASKKYKFNPDGGDLGLGDNQITITEVKKLDYPVEK